MELKKGAVIPIRVKDPGQRLARDESKTAGAHLLLGVSGDNLVFYPASAVSQDQAGRTYSLSIPFGQSVKLIINSSFFQLADSAGVPLPKAVSTSIPISAPAGQTPSTIALTVTDGGR